MIQFRRADRSRVKAKIALPAPTGAGKTFTGLVFARMLAQLEEDSRVAVLDAESGRAELYADQFEFDTITPDMFPQPWVHTPENYMAVIEAAISSKYAVLLIDGFSQEWIGRGGILEIVDAEKVRTRNEFGAWNGPSQRHRKLLETIVAAPIHLIVTMREDMEYVLEPGRNGGLAPKKVGMAPQQRKGVEYEFDVIVELDSDGNASVTKTRCSALRNVVTKLPPDGGIGHTEIIQVLVDWLEAGGEAREPFVPAQEQMLQTAPSEEAPAEPEDVDDLKESYACYATSKKSGKCLEVIYRDGDYKTYDGSPFLGSTLIKRGLERWQKVFCYAHYTMKAKIEADAAAAANEVEKMKADDAKEEPKKPRRPAKPKEPTAAGAA